MRLLLTSFLITISASFVTYAHGVPFDNIFSADNISDVTLFGSAAYPYAYALGQEDRKLQRITTTASMQLLTGVFTDGLKKITKRERPDKSDKKSFPSGHTSMAFVSAASVCAQTKKTHCQVALAFATTTGILRVVAKRHHWSDVFVGAGLGFFMGAKGPELMPKLVVNF